LYRRCFAAAAICIVCIVLVPNDTNDTYFPLCDIVAIRSGPITLAIEITGPAMTKTASIYAAQILLGLIAMAAGYAKLTGAGLMVQQFQMLGIGQGFLSIAGAAEIVAGLCLLLPRGGIVGAVLLAGVMVGALGVTVGHVASAATQPHPVTAFTATGFNSHQSGDEAGSFQIVRPRAEWDI